MSERFPFHELSAFQAVAVEGSFRGAARRLEVSPSALSHAVRSLEDRLGVRLLNRTTRSVSLTPEGEALLSEIAGPLAALDAALTSTSERADKVAGTLRISAPRWGAREVLLPAIARLTARHPDARVHVVSDDALVDLVAGGFDAGMRFVDVLEPDMIARAFGPPQRFGIVASPHYLDSYGTPSSPAELRAHRCVQYLFPGGRRFAWELQRGNESLSVDVRGPLLAEDTELALDAARAGVGLAYVYMSAIAAELANGSLVEVLPEWSPPPERFHLVYSSRRLQRPVLRALLDVLE